MAEAAVAQDDLIIPVRLPLRIVTVPDSKLSLAHRLLALPLK